MNKTNRILFAAFLLLLCHSTVDAQALDVQSPSRGGWTPFQISLIDPLQLFPEETDVYGLRLNLIYGKNRNFRGLDFGLWNIAEDSRAIQLGIGNQTDSFHGIQLGLANVVMEDAYVLQFGGINGVGGQFRGIQIGIVNDLSSPIHDGGNSGVGLQLGVFNFGLFPLAPWAPADMKVLGQTEFTGIQFAAFNMKHSIHGLSVGLVNWAQQYQGLQVGIVNYTERMKGVQIGLLNFISTGKLSFFPVMNMSF